MVKYLSDKNDTRELTLLYSVRNEADIAYKSIFEQARQAIGVNTIYSVTDRGATISDGSHTIAGHINGRLIKQAVPDYQDRIFYISGTHSMVNAMHAILQELGVSHHNIKVDFFPGYA
jgi:ferredoxin-NADP reductase